MFVDFDLVFDEWPWVTRLYPKWPGNAFKVPPFIDRWLVALLDTPNKRYLVSGTLATNEIPECS